MDPLNGFVNLASDVNDVGEMSALGSICADVQGSRAAWGMDSAVDLGIDANGDRLVDAQEAERDYLFLAHGVGGLLGYDVTDRAHPFQVLRVPMPISALDLTIDRANRKAYVVGGSGGLVIVDLSGRPRIGTVDQDGDGLDDRIVEWLPIGEVWSDVGPVIVPELGLVYVAGDHGVAAVASGGPRLQAVARTAEGGSWAAPALAPLGVPTHSVSGGSGAPPETARDLPAAFRILAALPGASGAEVRLDVLATGPEGGELADAGAAGGTEGLPRTALAGADGLALSRLAEHAWEEGSQWYLSEELVAVADLRAAKAYVRTAKESEQCTRCDRAVLGIDPEATELLSGDEIRVAFAPDSPLAAIYGAERIGESGVGIPSTRWETSPSNRQEPALNPSTGRGDVVPGTLLHSGEFTMSATDLAVAGRGLDFAFTRTYRNQTIGSGPLGPGWEIGYRMRLRELPDGDVELYDGRGRREIFELSESGELEAPAGWFVELRKSSSGFTLLDAAHNLTRFDRHGRLRSVADGVKQSETTGNEITFHYDPASRLTRVVDTLGREYTLEYDDAGRLERLKDFQLREVVYTFGDGGQLESVSSPEARLELGGAAQRLTTRYTYSAPGTSSLTGALSLRDNLESVEDPRGEVPVEVSYTDADGDGRAEEATGEVWGGHALSVDYDFEARTTVVTDRRGNPWTYLHDAAGRATRMEDPTTAAIVTTYDDEGLVASVTAPMGRRTEMVYAVDGERRSRGNVLSTTVTPDSRGPNGSSASLTTTVEYEGYSNQPIRIVDPRQAVTRIVRDEVGLPESVIEAEGAPETGTTRTEYNAFGQPTKVVNPNLHVTTFDYFETGAERGYLRRTTVDPEGLAITTRYEVDGRGNTRAVIDPRGVKHETVYNELDWVLASKQATTPSTDGAPALGYTTTQLYDENGNVVESRLPFGADGSSHTKVLTELGLLDEVKKVEREILPGGERAVELRDYDPNFNLRETIGAELQITRYAHDSRNLLESVTRGFGTEDAVTESYGYDAEGARMTYTDGRLKTSLSVYDGYGRVAEAQDPLGNLRRTSYDDTSNPIEALALGFEGAQLARTTSEYDLRSRPRFERRWLWSPGGGDPEAVVHETRYDAAGQITMAIDPRSHASSFEYDAAGRRKASTDPEGNRVEWTFDANGNARLTTLTEQLPEGGTIATSTSAKHDALNRTIEVVDPLGNPTQTVYDARGNARLVIDAEGYFTESVHDGLDRVVRTVRPEGISVDYGYDKASRLRTYTDALNQTTTYDYDALDRRRRTTYPDTRTERVRYDASGNPIETIDGLGTIVTQSFDDASRLVARTVAPAEGVVGPLVESFQYDGLNRLTRAQSGDVVSTRVYDSLSRIREESTGGRTVAFDLDAVGNPTSELLPSGLSIPRIFDDLNRPSSIAGTGYGYRGPDLVASKQRGEVLQRLSYDGARRLVLATEGAAGEAGLSHSERLSWSPRNLKSAISREDASESSLVLDYDGAGRLTTAANLPDLAASLANNSTPNEALLDEATNRFGFRYDAAENLLRKDEVEAGVEEATALPLDGSGRNRPGSVDGVALAWDANGNLVQKGDRAFHYDFRNRLTRVSGPSGEIARYRYDAFNRRVEATSGSVTTQTAWSGWRPVETYENGDLKSRRVYGLGLDEIVRQEVDLDGDGTTETAQLPVYDSTGSLVAVLNEQGKPVERYRYTPYGERTVLADLLPPEVEQVRVVGGQLWLEVSEAISLEALSQAIETGAATLTETATNEPIALAATQPIDEGKNARRRQVLSLEEAPGAGTEVRLRLEPAAIVDEFLNEMEEPAEWTFAWPASNALVADSASPRVQTIRVRSGLLEVELSEEATPASAGAAIRLNGATTTGWQLSESRYVLTTPIPSGDHALAIATTPLDLDGRGLSAPIALQLRNQGLDNVAYEAPDPRESPETLTANRFGFHGLERDPATGLVYMRNRWFDPEMGRFVTKDPLGFVDGPSEYAFVGGDPANASDPFGLYEEDVHQFLTWYLARAAGFSDSEAFQIGNQTQQLDRDSRSAVHHLVSQENMDRYHFVSARRLLEMRAISRSQTTLGPEAYRGIGELLHAMEDSYSHQKGEFRRDFGNYYRSVPIYSERIGDHLGHLSRGHEADWTWERPELAMEMAEDVYLELVALCFRFKGSCSPTAFSRIRPTLWRFMVYEPTLAPEGSLPVLTVADYGPKLRVLSSDFGIQTHEKARRAERVRKLAEENAFWRQYRKSRPTSAKWD